MGLIVGTHLHKQHHYTLNRIGGRGGGRTSSIDHVKNYIPFLGICWKFTEIYRDLQRLNK